MGDRELQAQKHKQQTQTLAAGPRDTAKIAIFLVAIVFLVWLTAYHSVSRVQPLQLSQLFGISAFGPPLTTVRSRPDYTHEDRKLDEILREASMEEKTVIITTLNSAWAQPNSTFDLFLESFREGQGTERLLRHVVVACLDAAALSRCSEALGLRRCYSLTTNGTDFSGEKRFMSPNYLKMMWRRIHFLSSVLKLGYNFLFTDADIMWLRDPFPHLYADADFQIACDHFNGNTSSVRNEVNGGFTYVRASNRTVEFYKTWYKSRLRFPGKHDQDVFNRIKNSPRIAKFGLKMRFLDTDYIGGFCQMRGHMDKVCTMHANCCIGQENKVKDLRKVLEDWRSYLAADELGRRNMTLRRPENCLRSMGL